MTLHFDVLFHWVVSPVYFTGVYECGSCKTSGSVPSLFARPAITLELVGVMDVQDTVRYEISIPS